MLAIGDPFVAWCLDRAIWTLASTIEQEQESADSRLPPSAKPKTRERTRERILRQYLGLEEETAGSFRNPGR